MPAMQILSAIELFHEATLVPDRWGIAMETMARACGATGATLYRLPAGPERALTTPNLTEVTEEYAARWWQHDTRATGMMAFAATRPLTDDDLSSREDRRRDPFYREFLNAYDLGHFGAVVASPVPGMRFAVTIERGSRPFEKPELERFLLMSRHAAQAIATAARIQTTEHFASELTSVMENVGCGVIFLDEQGRVRFLNPRGERLLGDGLVIADGHLEAANSADQRKLDRLIGSVLPGSVIPAGESIFVSRPSGRAPLVVQAHPLRARGHPSLRPLGLRASGGVLLVHDLAVEPRRSLLRELKRLGLSPAEARVAELVGQGHSVKEAADRLRIAEGTARTQLKSAYARLGIVRQSELAILITRLDSMRG
jgi:DNA-binding CsgD family transcriptional regulator/PAS domain-containing protein